MNYYKGIKRIGFLLGLPAGVAFAVCWLIYWWVGFSEPCSDFSSEEYPAEYARIVDRGLALWERILELPETIGEAKGSGETAEKDSVLAVFEAIQRRDRAELLERRSLAERIEASDDSAERERLLAILFLSWQKIGYSGPASFAQRVRLSPEFRTRDKARKGARLFDTERQFAGKQLRPATN